MTNPPDPDDQPDEYRKWLRSDKCPDPAMCTEWESEMVGIYQQRGGDVSLSIKQYAVEGRWVMSTLFYSLDSDWDIDDLTA